MKLLPNKEMLHGIQTLILIILLLFLWDRSRDSVRAESIELTSNGKTVAVLKANNDGEAEFHMIGNDGQSVRITSDGITGWDKPGSISFNLQNSSPLKDKSYGPGLTLYDDAGENRAAMYLSEGSPFFTFSSYHDRIDGGMRFATNLLMHSTTQTAHIELYDKDENRVRHTHGKEN